jgi:hypothetical protein
MPKTYKFRELVAALRKHDPRFEIWKQRGKGSERMIYHPDVDGRPQSHPIKCHNENDDVRRGVVASIVRRFNLPRDLL